MIEALIGLLIVVLILQICFPQLDQRVVIIIILCILLYYFGHHRGWRW